MGASTIDPFETFWSQCGPITALAGYDASTSWIIDIKNEANKAILVKNTGTSALTYQILASIDNGVEFDIPFKGDTVVAPAAQSLYEFSNHFTNIKIQVKGVGGIAIIKATASGN